MPDYKPGYLTQAGQNLAQQAVNAQIKLQFTRAVISSDDYSNTTDDAIRNLTTLSSFTSINIGYGQQLNSTDMVYPLRFSNYNLTQDNYVRTIGVYASDGTNEYLYSVLVNQSPEILSAYNGSTPETIKVNFQVYVGLASQVKVVMQDIDAVTVDQLNGAVSAANSQAQSLADSATASADNQLASKANVTELHKNVSDLLSNVGLREYSSDHANDINSVNTILATKANADELHKNVNDLLSNVGLREYSSDHASDVNSINAVLATKANTVDMTSTIKNSINNGDNLDNYTVDGTYPIASINLGGLQANLGLPNITINGILTVDNQGVTGTQTIKDDNNNVWQRQIHRAWHQIANADGDNATTTDVTNSLSSLATSINANQSSASSGIASNAASINNVFQSRGQYSGDLLNVAFLLDGYYTILNNTINAPNGFDGYGYFQKKVIGTDFYVELYDNYNHHWTNHYGNSNWDGWKQVPDTDEVSSAISSLNSITSLNASNISTNASNISVLQNSTNNLSSGISSNASNIASVASSLSDSLGGYSSWLSSSTNSNSVSLSNNIGTINNQIASLKQFGLNGTWSDSLYNLWHAKDGYWSLSGNTNGGPSGFNGWGIAIVIHNGSDAFVRIWDSSNNEWRIHFYSDGTNAGYKAC